MSCDAFLSEALYEADKALKKFPAAPRECACLQDDFFGRSRRWMMFYFVILRSASINGLHLFYVCTL